MALKILASVEKTRPITFLTNAEAHWISFVKHGANRTPFHVIKHDTGGKKVHVIQSILVPTGVKLSELAAKDGLTYLIDARSDYILEQEGYTEYLQIPAEEFQPDTMQIAKLDGSGAMVRVGALKKERNDALLYKGDILSAPIDAQAPAPPRVDSVEDVFARERQAMLDSIYGALGSSGHDAKKRKQIILAAIDAFKTSLLMLLDQVPGAIKVDGSPRTMEEIDTMNEWFKDKDEFAAFIKELSTAAAEEVFKAKQAEADEAAAKAEAEEAAKAEAAAKEAEEKAKAEAEEAAKKAEADAKETESLKQLEDKIEELLKDKADLKAQLDALAEKTESLGKTLDADPSAGAGSEGARKKEKIESDPRDWGLPLAGAIVAQG